MPIKFKRNYYLEKLDKLMNTDVSARAPSIVYLNPDGLARSWILVSIASTPYILWLLFKLKKFGWLISFALFVLLPFVLGYFVFRGELIAIILPLIALLNLGVFLFLLKHSYLDWREPDFTNTPGSDYK